MDVWMYGCLNGWVDGWIDMLEEILMQFAGGG